MIKLLERICFKPTCNVARAECGNSAYLFHRSRQIPVAVFSNALLMRINHHHNHRAKQPATGCVPVALDVQVLKVLSIQPNCSSCIRNISSSTPSLSPSMPSLSPGVNCLEGWDLSRSFLRRFCSARDRRPLEVSWDA